MRRKIGENRTMIRMDLAVDEEKIRGLRLGDELIDL